MVHDSQMSVRGQFVLLSSRFKIVALICNNRDQPELNVSHSRLATPSSAPTRDISKLILHLATVVGREIQAGITN